MPSPTHYEVLGIKPDADIVAIKRAWRKLSHVFHPDGSMGDKEKYTNIQTAYAVLLDADRRKKYDSDLLHPNDTQIFINISPQSAPSSSNSTSTALVPVTTYNLSELITISDLPKNILLQRLFQKVALALQGFKNEAIRNKIDRFDWISLAAAFYRKKDARLAELMVKTAAENATYRKEIKYSGYIVGLAKISEGIFEILVDNNLVDDLSGYDINQIKLNSKSSIRVNLIISSNATLLAKLNAYNRLISLTTLSDTTVELIHQDIATTFTSSYNPYIAKHFKADNELKIILFRHPSLHTCTEYEWISIAESNLAFAKLLAEESLVSQWTPNLLAKFALVSEEIYVKLLNRNLLISCPDTEFQAIHSKYPNVAVTDEALQKKLKRVAIFTDDKTVAELTLAEVTESLASAEYDSRATTDFLMKRHAIYAFSAFRNPQLRARLYLHEWVSLAIDKHRFAITLIESKYFLKHYALTSEMIKGLALSEHYIAVALLNSTVATLLNGNDLHAIQQHYKNKEILDIILNNPDMHAKICADHQAKHALSNLDNAAIESKSEIPASDDEGTRIYKLALALSSKDLLRKGIAEFHHKGCFEHLLKIGDLNDYKYCYDKFGDDEELAHLKETCRETLYLSTRDKRYQSQQDREKDALLQEQNEIQNNCASLYNALRNTTSFTFFRSNYFNDNVRSYEDIKRHATRLPNSRAAICLEIAEQLSHWYKAQNKPTIVLSKAAMQVLLENKKFFKWINTASPEFMNALAEKSTLINHAILKNEAHVTSKQEPALPSESIELVDVRSFINSHIFFTRQAEEKRLADSNISHSEEGNPAIRDCKL